MECLVGGDSMALRRKAGCDMTACETDDVVCRVDPGGGSNFVLTLFHSATIITALQLQYTSSPRGEKVIHLYL